MPLRHSPGNKIFAGGVLLLMPLAVLYATQLIWMQDWSAPLLWMGSQPASAGLFWLLFTLPTLTVYGLCRRLLPALLPGTLAAMALAVVARMKMDTAGTPLLLSDFSMAGKAKDLTGFAGEKLLPSPMTAAAVGGVVLLLVLIGVLDSWRPPVPLSLTVGILCLLLTLSALLPGPLQSAAIALDAGCQDQSARCQKEGTVLGLYAAWSQRQAVERADYTGNAAGMVSCFREEALAADAAGDLSLPDIIFITSESFFDVTQLPGVTFRADPLPVFHALSAQCTSGRFLTNTFGGGTGGVEMELFTGLTSAYLREGDTLNTFQADCYDTLPSMVRVLRQAGYETTAVHSHTSTLYRRDIIYPRIGFENTVFIRDFLTEPVKKGPYTSDESFAREIIARYEAREPDRPCFLYGMSMENHQAYEPEKYGQPSGYPAESDLLSQDDLAILDSLVFGLRDADLSLELLTDYFSKVDRPVLLVFVGDHLPSVGLADGTPLFQRLGCVPPGESAGWSAEQYRAMQTTDYLIWSNQETEGQSVPDRDESCTFLGLHTLERAGVPLNAYFGWLARDVAPRLSIDRGRLLVDGAGVTWEKPPETMTELLNTYADVERGLLYGIP